MQRFFLFLGALLLHVIAAYAQNPDEGDLTIAYYTRIIEQQQHDPHNVAAYHARSIAYAAKGEYDRAIADISHIISEVGSFLIKSAATMPSLRINGDRQSRSAPLGNRPRATESLFPHAGIIHVLPDLTWPYGERATLYFAKKEYDRAISDFTTAISMDDSDEHDDHMPKEFQMNPRRAYEYYNDRGVSYMEKGEYDKSIADLTHSINLKRNNAKRVRRPRMVA
jgi:tetratricopeptide (TPR) repeat protein